MGCDGGTIPKRCELVKEKKKKEQKDKDVEMMIRWLLCALSQLQLRMPIMACELGRLYNKESILEFLLDRTKFETGEKFNHIRSMKDVHELKLTPNPAVAANCDQASSSSSEALSSKFICPISQLEFNGKHKFLYPVKCGCVISERALRELTPSQKNGTKSKENGKPNNGEIPCPVCGVLFNYTEDIVMLNPETETEIADAKNNMERRRALQKAAKKSKESSNGKRNLEDVKTTTAEVPKKSSKIVSSTNKTTVNAPSKITIPQTAKNEEKSAVYRSLFTKPKTYS